MKAAAARTSRLIGVAFNTQHTSDTGYTTTAGNEFNYVTPENEMKWQDTEPTQGSFTFAAGDQVVSFATQNGMQVKGHNFVWFSELPTWVTNLSSATTVQTAIVNHINGLAGHYKGKIHAWDVVNEAWNADGMTLRNDVFEQFLGSAYIDLAFQTARAADPNAKLYYNDFGTEGMSAKANAVFTMVQSMVSRGIPIDGVGMQMHTQAVDAGPSVADFVANMQRIAALGLEVVVSEFDVELCSGTTAAQMTRFHDIVAACMGQPACKAVTVWGVTDKFSWLNGRDCANPDPLLFDDSYNKKPAYTGVLDAFNGL